MPKVIGVEFDKAGRIYYFDPLDLEFNKDDFVVVETIRGVELGKVVLSNHEISNEQIATDLKPVIRKGTEEDIKIKEENIVLSQKAFISFKKNIEKLNLDMKPLYAEYTLDRNKILFYYTADDRVDFRDLLKTLTPEFHIRIELRQIGPREAARIVGALGTCGQEVCCKTHLRDFDVVTMKMAKDQSMSLNTSKISGACGKLMCCIAYENEIYQTLRKEHPAIGTFVKTPTCENCRVVGVDLIKGLVKTQEAPNALPVVHPVADITIISKDKKNE